MQGFDIARDSAHRVRRELPMAFAAGGAGTIVLLGVGTVGLIVIGVLSMASVTVVYDEQVKFENLVTPSRPPAPPAPPPPPPPSPPYDCIVLGCGGDVNGDRRVGIYQGDYGTECNYAYYYDYGNEQEAPCLSCKETCCVDKCALTGAGSTASAGCEETSVAGGCT